MRVLITGGTGVISSYITKTLSEKGHEVIHINHHDKSTSESVNTKTVVCDRKDYERFIQTCQSLAPFDCVYDMICYTPEDADSAIQAFAGQTRQLVFCSTVDVYTKYAERYPITENSLRDPSVEHPYAYNKALCEDKFLQAHMRNDFSLTIMRPAHTYSEGHLKSHLLFPPIAVPFEPGYYLDRIKKGLPIILHGDGLSIWNATHGCDIGAAFAAALNNPACSGKSYTLCGDESMPYQKMWDIAARVMGAPKPQYVCIPSELLFRIAPVRAKTCYYNYKYNNVFDNSAAKVDLGLCQTVSFEDGIKRSLEYYKGTGGFDSCEKPEYSFYDDIIRVYRESCENLVSRFAQYGL